MRFTASLPLPAAACSKLIALSQDPRDVYAWLENGDPLELQPRVAKIIREQAYLVDIERVVQKVMIYLARDSSSFTEGVDLNRWLELRTGPICRLVLEKDAQAWAKNSEWLPPDYVEMCHMLTLPPHRLMRSLTDFHRQPFEIRQAFFQLLILTKSPIQVLAEGLGPPWLLRERCLYACKALYLTPHEKARGEEGWHG